MVQESSAPLHRRNFMLHLQERPEYDELVFLKEPAHEQLTGSQIAQLHNEHVITRQLDHVPGVRPVYTIEGSESHPVLLLKYIQGQSLVEIIQGQSLDLPQKLQLAVENAGILGRIHEAGLMHRDISSSNILVAEDVAPGEHGGVYIIDFGLASTMRQEEISKAVVPDTVAGEGFVATEEGTVTGEFVATEDEVVTEGVEVFPEDEEEQTTDE